MSPLFVSPCSVGFLKLYHHTTALSSLSPFFHIGGALRLKKTSVIAPTSDGSSLVCVAVALTLNLRRVASLVSFARHHHLRLLTHMSRMSISCARPRHHPLFFFFLFLFVCIPTGGPECMLTEMNTDQMYVVDAFFWFLTGPDLFYFFLLPISFFLPFTLFLVWLNVCVTGSAPSLLAVIY